MIIALVVCLAILAVLLFALYWKGDVKAGFKFLSVAFFIEASERRNEAKTEIEPTRQ